VGEVGFVRFDPLLADEGSRPLLAQGERFGRTGATAENATGHPPPEAGAEAR
jgi:hypothetical protein